MDNDFIKLLDNNQIYFYIENEYDLENFFNKVITLSYMYNEGNFNIKDSVLNKRNATRLLPMLFSFRKTSIGRDIVFEYTQGIAKRKWCIDYARYHASRMYGVIFFERQAITHFIYNKKLSLIENEYRLC